MMQDAKNAEGSAIGAGTTGVRPVDNLTSRKVIHRFTE